MKVAFEGDTITAVNDGSYEIRPDHFLVQFFSAPAHVGINRLEPVVATHFFEGFSVHLVPLLLAFGHGSAFAAGIAGLVGLAQVGSQAD